VPSDEAALLAPELEYHLALPPFTYRSIIPSPCSVASISAARLRCRFLDQHRVEAGNQPFFRVVRTGGFGLIPVIEQRPLQMGLLA
jgi:hypothetical protein